MTQIIVKMKNGLAGPSGQKIIRRLWMVPAAGVLWVMLSYNVRTMGLSGRVEKAIERYKTMEQQAAANLKTPNKTIEEMKKKSLFAEQSQPSIPQCLGILGQYALFDQDWHKVGDTVGEAKIVSVGPAEVKILWQGKEQILRPFDVPVEYKKSQAGGPPSSGQPTPAAQPQSEPPQNMPPMGGRGFGPFNMSPEDMGRMRDRFMNMSPEERRRAFEEMRGRRGQ
jgi:hypothetical protein